MKTLFLLRGVPGCGKSTAAEILSDGTYPVLAADMYFEDSEGNYNWDASKVREAHNWCVEQVRIAMQIASDGASLVGVSSLGEFLERQSYDCSKIFVTNTFTQAWEMDAYYDLATKYGYLVVSMIVENRHGGENVHSVPAETIEKMTNRFEIKLV